ncbi:hypothetical protein IID24_04200 [Patescibacteria group bacterium]|nr:hypothetical protein [Patescibacteria group bacterium]
MANLPLALATHINSSRYTVLMAFHRNIREEVHRSAFPVLLLLFFVLSNGKSRVMANYRG